MTAIYIILGVLAFLLLAFVLVCEIGFKLIFGGTNEVSGARYEKNFDKKLPPEFAKIMNEGREYGKTLPWEEVYIDSYDGYKLHGKLYAPKDAKICLVLCHGYKESGDHDFSGIIRTYAEKGYALLLVDQRAHVKSEGKYICFGIKERYDIRDWCRYLDERLGLKIILSGVSMGTTSVLLAACLPDISKNLIAVTADCGFNSMYDEFVHVAKNMIGVPTFPFLNVLELMCKKRLGIDMRAVRISDEIKNIKVPVFFLHGEADGFVPCENSIVMHEACPTEKRLVTVAGAEHGLSYLVDNERCERELLSFLEKVTNERV